MKKLHLLIIIVATLFFTGGCNEIEKNVESVRSKVGSAETLSEKLPLSKELQKEIDSLPNQYENKKAGFAFKYPSNWGEVEQYESGDVSIDRLNNAEERTGAYAYITIYTDSPTRAPMLNDKLFEVETELQMTKDGWTDLKFEKVTKHKWKDGVWFVTEYEGKSDGYQIYAQEYYWENKEGNIRIFGFFFYDKEELAVAQREIEQIVYSLNPNFK